MNPGAGGRSSAPPPRFLKRRSRGAGAAAAAPVDDALARARAQKTWEDPQWRRLGHYKPLAFGRGWRSDASGAFFLAPGGARDPRAELEALTAALFSAEPSDGRSARCRFPARSGWLIAALGLDAAALPPARCAEYDEWRGLLGARAATMIFASAYVSNPSSMFGHTFLRIEKEGARGGDALLANALNFAADIDVKRSNDVFLALKGLAGLYPGRYSVMPFYVKVQEYNNLESRDLWEYSLLLSSAEVDALAAHAWEMRQASFPYYFFSKNCSYQLMPALEAAVPRATLMPGSPWIVAPADTIRILRSSGLAAPPAYRPAHSTVMSERRRLLTARELRAADAYRRGRFDEGDRLSSGMAPERRALVLDAAEDYVLYKKGYSPNVPDGVRALERGLLVRRAKTPGEYADPPAPSWAAAPEEGHDRRRLMVGGGASKGGSFTELSWRPGYHDLLDRPRGFVPGASVEGLSWRLRYETEERRLYVRDFRLAEILSVSPWDSWTRAPSWDLGTGLDTAFEKGREASRSLVYEGHGGVGLTGQPREGVGAFVLAQAESAVGPVLNGGGRLDGALRGGVTLELARDVHAVLDGALTATALGDKTPNHRLRADVNWAPSRDRALRAELLLRGPYREAGVYAILYH